MRATLHLRHHRPASAFKTQTSDKAAGWQVHRPPHEGLGARADAWQASSSPSSSTSSSRPCMHGEHSPTTTNHVPMTRRQLGLSYLTSLVLPVLHEPGMAHAALVEEDVTTAVYAKACLSVVSIVNYKMEGGAEVADSIGTGIVWDKLGHIVTNYHVISKVDKSLIPQATRVVVGDAAGTQQTTYSIELVGADAMHDLAVLRIVDADAAAALQPISFGLSSELKVGQSAFAVGNAYGLTRTLSVGVISGLDRTIVSPVGTRIYGAIQTDASINAGNSGGPLLDSSAQMVGMNTSTYTRSGTGRGSGVNFALPGQLLLELVPQLIVYGNSSGKR